MHFKNKFILNLKDSGKLIWLPVIVYFIIFTSLAIIKYNAYNMAMVDLGRMSQALWNTLNGRFFFSTFEHGNMCRLIFHSEFIYLFIAPLYLLFPDPKTLLILQTLVISLGAIPIYRLTKDRLNSGFTALCFLLAYLLYPSLQYGNLSDFHPDMLATTLLLFTFYYADKKRWVGYFIFLLLSIMCKEYVSLVVIMLGVYLIKRNSKIAITTIFLGIFWFLMTYKFIPMFLYGRDNMMVKFYDESYGLGTSMGMMLKNIILHPIMTVNRCINLNKIISAIFLFLPVGFLSFLNIPVLSIIVPVFIGQILYPYFSYTNHHNGVIIPFIFISAIAGSQYLANKLKLKFKNITFALGIFIISSSLLANFLYGTSPLSLRFWLRPSYRYWNNLHQFRITRHDKIADKFVKLIPDKVPIFASNHLGSHVSRREVLNHLWFAENFKDIDYIFADILENYPFCWLPREDERRQLKEIFSSQSDFSLIRSEDGLLLFSKKAKAGDNYLMQVKTVNPKEKVFPPFPKAVFGRRLELLDYKLENAFLEKGKKQRISYYWRISDGFKEPFTWSYFKIKESLENEYIIIDTIFTKENYFRIIHLPMYVMKGPEEWRPGEIIKETMDFYVPEDLASGHYYWSTGLYVAPNYYFIETQDKGLVPGTVKAQLAEIELK